MFRGAIISTCASISRIIGFHIHQYLSLVLKESFSASNERTCFIWFFISALVEAFGGPAFKIFVLDAWLLVRPCSVGPLRAFGLRSWRQHKLLLSIDRLSSLPCCIPLFACPRDFESPPSNHSALLAVDVSGDQLLPEAF
jgi:hypothetical protein